MATATMALVDNLETDKTLVERCLTGDETAWDQLVRAHTRKVYSLCYRFTNSDAEAQDLTQEVFLRIFRSVKSFRSEEGSFGTWLARLTRNLLIDNYRRTRQDRVTDSIEVQMPMLEEELAATARPDGLVVGREAREHLQWGLQKLSPELRETLILRDLQEMEYREIAEVLQIPEGTVKSRLNRARTELARVLRKKLGSGRGFDIMTCTDFDALLCDYVDNALAAEHRQLMEVHLSTCAACAELIRDTRAVLDFVDRSAGVEVPPELVTRILQQVPQGGWLANTSSRWLGSLLHPVLQPRFFMGAMLTVLSLAMMTRCAGAPKHALTAADLDPIKLWTNLDDRVHRGWERSVKTYESMKLVYEVQSRVKEWKQQQQEDEEESKRLPRPIPTVQPGASSAKPGKAN